MTCMVSGADIWTARELLDPASAPRHACLAETRAASAFAPGTITARWPGASCPDSFAEAQPHALAVLPQCSRCERDRDDTCLNAGWDTADRVAVTCDCGCWKEARRGSCPV